MSVVHTATLAYSVVAEVVVVMNVGQPTTFQGRQAKTPAPSSGHYRPHKRNMKRFIILILD